MQEASYEYLKKWLSRDEIREIREGKNIHGIKLTPQQCLNIMKMKSKNFRFRNLLVQKARENESITTGKPIF